MIIAIISYNVKQKLISTVFDDSAWTGSIWAGLARSVPFPTSRINFCNSSKKKYKIPKNVFNLFIIIKQEINELLYINSL